MMINSQLKVACINSVAVLMGFFGIGIILACTSKYGIGISPDSVSYLYCARSLIGGKGLMDLGGHPYVTWPPLFPVILALGAAIGINLMDFARFLNAVLFGLIIFFSIRFFRLFIEKIYLIFVGAMLVLFSLPLLMVSVMAWSDPFFILLGIIYLHCMVRYFNLHQNKYLYFSGVAVVLATLLRYAGVTFILTGVIVLLFLQDSKQSIVKLFFTPMVYGFLTAVPLLIVFMRNYQVSGTIAGDRMGATLTLQHYIPMVIKEIMLYFLADVSILTWPDWSSVLGLITLFLMVSVIVRKYIHDENKNYLPYNIWLIFIFIAVNLSFIIYTSVNTQLEASPYRYLLIVYIPFITLSIVFLQAIDQCAKRSSYPLINRSRHYGLIMICFVWFATQMNLSTKAMNEFMRYGAGGFNTEPWHHSKLVEYIKDKDFHDGTIYSNAIDAIYLFTGKDAVKLSKKSSNTVGFLDKIAAKEKKYLIWFNGLEWRSYLCNIEELEVYLNLYPMAVFPEGGVYIMRSK